MKTLSRPLWQGRFATRSTEVAVARTLDRVVPLKPESFHLARSVLAGNPAHHTYLLGCMEQYGPALFHGPHTWFGLIAADSQEALGGVAYVGRTTHLAWTEDPRDAPLDDLAAWVAGYELDQNVQAIIGPPTIVAGLVDALGRDTRQVVDRGTQLVMEVSAASLNPFARSAALAPSLDQDIHAIFLADREMIRDEIGVDTVANDPEGYWEATYHRVADRRTWSILGPDGALFFKVDVAAVSTEAAVVAGVFTSPAMRRRGLARAAIGEICHYLLRSVPRVMLAVYADNAPALALYRSLGFRVVAETRSVWFI